MDIQWVILAQDCRLNNDRTVDIEKISHHANIYGDNTVVSMKLIAKLHITPNDANKEKKLSLQIVHYHHGVLDNRKGVYKPPNLTDWADSVTYLVIPMNDVRLPYAGVYAFKLFVDDAFMNEETIEATDLLKGG